MNRPVGRPGVLLGAAILFISSAANFLPNSFAQAQRDLVGCDPLCYGYLQSFTSAVSFCGALLVGRLSDSWGRLPVLYGGALASLVAHVIGISANNRAVMFIAAVPSCLNQNHSVMKTLVSDWLDARPSGVQGEKEACMGYLGMAAGLSFMVGPLLGAVVFSSYQQAKCGAIAGLIISVLVIRLLPQSPIAVGSRGDIAVATQNPKVVDVVPTSLLMQPLIRLKSAFAIISPGARLLLGLRMCMGLAYSIYNAVFMASLKTRFDFSPFQYGLLMSWIGLIYAISQGFIAKRMILLLNNDTLLLLYCSVVMGVGRAMQMHVRSVYPLYAILFVVISALGTMNTVISAATAKVASEGAVGSLFGSMEAVEKLAALFGPATGGLLFTLNPFLPTLADIVLYLIVFTVIFMWYQNYVVTDVTEEKSNLGVGAKLKRQ